ncbi:hypothetical protein AVEN_203783-1 [Araneus ventricosus]|uniref:Uncharacterized protein n=1 Tax=Araneus ventricosus TaxID=182803 RepID=A0A4Y2WPX9_ARAVE|nr:hypothetical protein AVEN_203783-1 [Araneus ventricosus]
MGGKPITMKRNPGAGQEFLPPTTRMPQRNAPGQRGEALAGTAGEERNFEVGSFYTPSRNTSYSTGKETIWKFSLKWKDTILVIICYFCWSAGSEMSPSLGDTEHDPTSSNKESLHSQ